MENSQQLAYRFREVLLDGKWIANTNYKEQLLNITWQEATQEIGSLNSIAALTFHINYYLEGLVDFFEKGSLDIHDKYSFDLPPIHSKEDWELLVSNLISNAEKFGNHVEQMPSEKLKETFIDVKYGNYQKNINGVIEHCYYHLGQISLIRKMIQELNTA